MENKMGATDSDAERLVKIQRDHAAGKIIVAFRDFDCLLRLLDERDAEIVQLSTDRYKLQEKLTASYGWGMKDGMSYARSQATAEREATERERERCSQLIADEAVGWEGRALTALLNAQRRINASSESCPKEHPPTQSQL